MKNHRAVLFMLIALALAAGSCRSRTDRSEGSVLLSVSRFNVLPSSVSLSSPDPAQFTIGTITLRNIPKDPTGATSSLQDIELRSYEVRYRRRDTGSRVPPPSVQGIFGIVPVGGTTDLINLGYLFSDQILSQPLRDLLDFGVDRETGTAVIVLDVTLRFFGRTLSGDDVVSEPATFTIEVFP
ncbi:MAG TPA: hypothetical protein VGG03_09920 [Thermoanaerobaculia bacterium]|jgi:hypothetical protein